MGEITLRDYQVKAIHDIESSWLLGHRKVFYQAGTGLGKSVIMSTIVLNHYQRGQHCAVIAHRNELVSQMSCHLAKRGIYHRVIANNGTVAQITRKHRQKFGKSFVNPTGMTAVIGIDTLLARADSLKSWCQQIDLWLVDESHHLTVENKWGKGVAMFINARGLGVSATPERADGQGLSEETDGVMNTIVCGPNMRWAIEQGFLADYEIVCPQSDMQLDESEVSANGDWSNVKMRKAAKASHIVGDVVKNYIKYGANRKAIVFATDIETADEIAKDFNENGIKAVSLNGKSLPAFREQSMDNFEKGDVKVLVNVDLFDEGLDISGVEICIMARPTCSLAKYLQQIGRALRPAPNKTALIIDHVSNVIRHGLPDRPRVWSLNRVNKKAKHEKDPDELELTTCVACSKPYEKFRTVCPYCGIEKPLPEPRSRSIEMVEGDLILLDKAKLDEMRRKIELETPEEVANRVSYAAGKIPGLSAAKKQREKIEAQEELKEEIAVWAGYERARGFNDREIHKRFYLTTGVDVLSALSSDNKRVDYNNTVERIKRWYK